MSQPPPDLFPQRPVRSEVTRVGFGRRSLLSRILRPPSYRARRIITVLVLALIAFVGLRAAFHGSSMSSGAIATIKAEGAWKQRPEQPGGLDIPNQKVQVYQALDNKGATPAAAEHLLPPPEVPQPALSSPAPAATAPAPNAPPAIESLTPPKLEIDSISTTVIESPPAPPATPAAVAEAPATVPAAAPAPAPAVAAAPVSPVAHTPAPAKPVKAKPMTMEQVLKDAAAGPKTDRIVQLASVPDEATAQAMADKLQVQYASVLGPAHLRLVKANVEGKGVFYRIQSQPVAGDQADHICSALKQMKAGCILVRP